MRNMSPKKAAIDGLSFRTRNDAVEKSNLPLLHLINSYAALLT